MKGLTARFSISVTLAFVTVGVLGAEAVHAQPPNLLINDNAGATPTFGFTQSEAAVLAFGNAVVAGFVDSGSSTENSNQYTGYSYSRDGGATFTDGGRLPYSIGGDMGDPVLAHNATTGRIYLATLGRSYRTIQVFRSDNGGVTWSAPVIGSPGWSLEDKPWLAVDNFPGSGNGNVYAASRSFGAPNAIRFFRSTDNGLTFGPNGGVLITTGQQGVFIVVGPDHAIYVFWHNGTTLQMRKSTDLGLTFGPAVTVASDLSGGVNGDLGLVGIRQGTTTAAAFRSNSFPHAAVNPISGHLYVTFNNKLPGVYQADVFMVMSTDGGATWSAAVCVNDDLTPTDQWMPTIAVSPAGDQLGIFYYSRQEDVPGNNLFKYYGRVGSIAGPTITFASSFAVSDTPSLPEFGRDSQVNTTYMGDYNTASATDGAFHVVWSDNRDDLPGGAPRKDPNVYYAQIVTGNVGVPESTSPLASRLAPAAPNPFRGATTLAFDQPADGDVTLEVYSPTGALLRTISEGQGTAGRHQVVWNGEGNGGRPLPAGVYFVRLTAGSYTAQSKVVKLP